jgi:hypothetical protein
MPPLSKLDPHSILKSPTKTTATTMGYQILLAEKNPMKPACAGTYSIHCPYIPPIHAHEPMLPRQKTGEQNGREQKPGRGILQATEHPSPTRHPMNDTLTPDRTKPNSKNQSMSLLQFFEPFQPKPTFDTTTAPGQNSDVQLPAEKPP